MRNGPGAQFDLLLRPNHSEGSGAAKFGKLLKRLLSIPSAGRTGMKL